MRNQLLFVIRCFLVLGIIVVSLTISPHLQQKAEASAFDHATKAAKLIAMDGDDNDAFGTAVAVSGNTILVGAPNANDLRGAAYVFVRQANGDYSQVAKLTASDGAAVENFGTSVAISGDTALIGAVAPTAGHQPGAAYVFVKPSEGWRNMTQTAKLTASDGTPRSSFGQSVSISDNDVIVGAPGTLEPLGRSKVKGGAYIFVRPPNGWTNMIQTARLSASDGLLGDSFGEAVSIDHHIAAVGAPEAHAVYVFVAPPKGWTNIHQTVKLMAPGSDGLGSSVSLRGNFVVSGAPFTSVRGNDSQGAAYVFESKPDWAGTIQRTLLTAPNGARHDQFGWSVSADANMIVIGAPAEYPSQAPGAAYLFLKPTAGWNAKASVSERLLAWDSISYPYSFSGSVSVSGNTVMAGAYGANIGSNHHQGAAYVFRR